jgi:2-desacetyl-2-hydroxyethyl bacteriochlorophyllide A dehydrogenase
MKTLILNEPKAFQYIETPSYPNLQPNEALLKVRQIGICGTDYHAYTGHQPFFAYPRILGHELGLEVLEIGKDVQNIQIGERCCLEPYFNAIQDQAVRRGFSNCGENISVFGVHQDGGMREFIKVKTQYLHTSPLLSFEQLALVEPLGIGCHAVNRANPHPEDLILVIGAGPIGLATLQFAKTRGAKTVVMDINVDRLNFCKTLFEIETVLAGTEDTEQNLRDMFQGDLPTVIFDATGNKHSMTQAMTYLAPAGKLIFIGLFQGDFTFNDPYFHKKEMTLMASRNALPTDFQQIIKMMEQGIINTDAWITHRCHFNDLVNQFEYWLQPESKVIKAIVYFS